MSLFDGIPFFVGLDPTRGEQLARQCVRRRYAEHELVLDFDDPSTDVYFIVSGDVRVLIRTAAGKEMIWLPHEIFLGTTADVDDLCDAIAKIRTNIDELSSSA